MKFQKITAVVLATTMVLGSAVTVFAADGATGQGTAFDHVNKDIISVTLPEDSAVRNVFNYYVDPEGVVKEAAKLTDGTAVTGNDDGVYFANTGGSYSAASDEVEFEGKNSIAVDISVKATVTAGENDIALVADADALAAATTPALLMNLTVSNGTDSDVQPILSTGATAKAQIEGVPANFEVTVVDSKYAYTVKDGATGWKKATVKLSGKTNNVDVTDGMTAPTIGLVWTIAKHTDAYVSSSNISASGNSLTLTMPEGVSVSSVALYKASALDTPIALTAGNQYTVADGKITVPANMLTAWGTGSKLTIKYSDNHTDDVNIQ
jgi:hypothetical protein